MQAFFRVSYIKSFCIALFFYFLSLSTFFTFFCEPRHYLWIKMMRLEEKRTDFFFFNLLFGCPIVNLGRLLRKSLTNSMLITAFLQFDLNVTGSLISQAAMVMSLRAAKHLGSFELDFLRFKCNTLTSYTLFFSFLVIYYKL